MALIWTLHGETNCHLCEDLAGRRDGDGWTSSAARGPKGEWAGGPPPRHPNCDCTVEQETAREWAESLTR